LQRLLRALRDDRTRRINKTDMKQIIDKFLIKKNIRPYKIIALSTGVIVEHYRNGKLKTEYYE
tara:strand:- start:813 stop:1001 length:189 start_codon:yes stop_codon:yes gene_type:complete